MSYLDQRPQALVEVKGIIRARPIILAIVFVVVVIVIVIILLLLTAPKSSSSSKCTSNSGCSGLASVCNTVTGICVECLTSTDCANGETCTVGNSCSTTKCTADRNCSASAPKCNTGNGQCVQCLVKTDCPIMGSSCNSNGLCIPPCTSPPNPVTNVSVSGNAGTNVVTWTAPVGGQVVSDYIVNQENNICGNTPGAIVATKVIPAGTTTATFTGLNAGFNCYRIQSQNGCGSTPIGSSPDANGVTCGNQPNPWSVGLYNYTIDASCTQPESLFPDCNCICGPNGVGNIPACGNMASFGNGPCSSYCSIPTCTTNSSNSTTCPIDLTWNGPYPGASQLVIFTRQNVTNNQASVTLEDSEATLPFNMSNPGFLSGTKIWYQQCNRTSELTNISVTAAMQATVTSSFPPSGTAGGGTVDIPAAPLIEWEPVSGTDEYAILVFNEAFSYGTLVPNNNIIDPMTGNAMYKFISPPAVTGASIQVYAYSYCNKSVPSSGVSVSS